MRDAPTSTGHVASRDELGELYRRHHGDVRRYVAARCPDAEVDDITHTVFVRLLAHLDDLPDDDEACVAYALRVAYNLVVDHHRSGRAQRLRYFGAVGDEDGNDGRRVLWTRGPPDPHDAARVAEVTRVVREALDVAALSDVQRDVLRLRYLAELTPAEVAARLGLRSVQVKSINHRGLRVLARSDRLRRLRSWD